jgi:hypothetical protein
MEEYNVRGRRCYEQCTSTRKWNTIASFASFVGTTLTTYAKLTNQPTASCQCNANVAKPVITCSPELISFASTARTGRSHRKQFLWQDAVVHTPTLLLCRYAGNTHRRLDIGAHWLVCVTGAPLIQIIFWRTSAETKTTLDLRPSWSHSQN